MRQNQMGGLKVIESDIGDAFNLAMARNYDCGYPLGLVYRGIDGDKALDSPGEQDVRVLVQQSRIVMVHHRHEKILALAERRLDASDHYAAVSVSNFRGDHAHGKCALLA